MLVTNGMWYFHKWFWFLSTFGIMTESLMQDTSLKECKIEFKREDTYKG